MSAEQRQSLLVFLPPLLLRINPCRLRLSANQEQAVPSLELAMAR